MKELEIIIDKVLKGHYGTKNRSVLIRELEHLKEVLND